MSHVSSPLQLFYGISPSPSLSSLFYSRLTLLFFWFLTFKCNERLPFLHVVWDVQREAGICCKKWTDRLSVVWEMKLHDEECWGQSNWVATSCKLEKRRRVIKRMSEQDSDSFCSNFSCCKIRVWILRKRRRWCEGGIERNTPEYEISLLLLLESSLLNSIVLSDIILSHPLELLQQNIEKKRMFDGRSKRNLVLLPHILFSSFFEFINLSWFILTTTAFFWMVYKKDLSLSLSQVIEKWKFPICLSMKREDANHVRHHWGMRHVMIRLSKGG